MSERLFYLDAAGTGFLAVFHPARPAGAKTAVLLVPPFGWEDIASYRSLRRWAEDLAAHGYPALRIELPRTGDSGGNAAEPATWAAWNAALTTASAWLHAQTGCSTLTGIGVGLGGLLVYESAARGELDDVVLWATPGRGRSAVREMVAFSAWETGRIVEAGAPEPPPLPEGWLAPSGFPLSPETVADLKAVDLKQRALAPSARALLLGRDGVKPDAELAASIEAAGAGLTVADGSGYAAMLTDPDLAHAPRQVFELTRAWLADAPDRPARAGMRGVPAERGELTVAGALERPFRLDWDERSLVGILTMPESGARAPLTAVFLNAGAIRRVGPHRMWTDVARRWARQGIPSLRVDLEGIGDSEGDEDLFNDVAHFHNERFVAQTRAVLDELLARGHGDRFILVGLCSGAYWAFQTAVADERVVSAVMVNPRVLYWDASLQISRELRRTRLLRKPVTWKRVLRGDVSAERWAKMLRWALGIPLRVARRLFVRDLAMPSVEERIAVAFDALQRRGVRARFVFCDGEPLSGELTTDRLLGQGDRWPEVSLTWLPGRDHTLRPLWMHEHAIAALDDAVAAELDSVRAAV